jgi:putative ABC transport system substrate-binding protein
MKRREFIKVIVGSTTTVWPLAVRAQQPTMPVIGFLNSGLSNGYVVATSGFKQGLKDGGYVEGQNVAIEYRWAEGKNERLPGLAADLVARKVALMMVNTAGLLPATKATKTIPIVFATSVDPVKLGVVVSLSRPGGNVTGVTSLNVDVGSKRLELLHEALPTAGHIAFLVHSSNPNSETLLKDARAAGRKLGMQISVLTVNSERDIEPAFSKLTELRASALVIGTDSLFNSRTKQLGALAARYRVPAVYEGRKFAEAGGLISYGGDVREVYRIAGSYASQVLKGRKPADLPVQESTKIELIINLKVAKALGLNVPNNLVGRADQLIE